LALFGRSKSGDADGNGKGDQPAFKRDPRKARRFFEHAQATADSRQYDYAIECYINGLKHEPDNLGRHEALYDVAKRRRAGGGKPAGITEKLKSGGKDIIDKMLHAEKLLAKDPTNEDLMIAVMEHAVAADRIESELNLAEVAYWVGSMALEWLAAAKKPRKSQLLKAADLFVAIKQFDKAIEASRMALQLDPENSALIQQLKDLEAENTMVRGGYGEGFRKSIKDEEKQTELEQQDQIAKTESAADNLILRRRAEYDEDPQDLDKVLKLVEALLAKPANETETEAIKLLKDAWETTGQYRFRVRVGDIQMRQIARFLRQLKVKLDADPGNAEIKQKYDEARKKRVIFELNEYTDRVKNYPTDMGLRFELGVRLLATGKIDEAISAFQQAKSDPKHRSAAHQYLGRCYLDRGWYEEALDTLTYGIENHPLHDDLLALDLHYLRMEAYEQLARRDHSVEHARAAQKDASHILQANINYKDIRERMESLRKLIDERAK
jgi:tetratricopeptide (TPR) repeat protein